MPSHRGSALRTANWLMHMALPMLALWLLLDRPKVDLAWDNRIAHFVLVLSAALVSVALGALIARAARARDDARLWLVSLVFMTTAGFFGLHALVTPGVLVNTSDAEFMLPTRIGLVLAGAVALASSVTFSPARNARLWSARRPLLALICALMASCAVTILCGLLKRLADQERRSRVTAARAALALHVAVEEAAAGHPDWPRFRVGLNSGPALVGNIGAAQMRHFTAVGDTTNLAARLQSLAQPGQVVLGPGTSTALGPAARISKHGWVRVKGRGSPVRLCVLHELSR